MKSDNQSWSEYLANKNATKNEKTFNITFRRKTTGEFEVMGNQAFMEANKGRTSEWVRVTSRDIARALRNNGIVAK
jgi:hypothetical protein